MVVSKRQFDHLTEMGIQLWQRKSLVDVDNKSDLAPCIEIDDAAVMQNQLFIDVLICLGISTNDIIHKDNKIQLGLYTWLFSTEDNITVTDKTLTTPEISHIAQSSSLKVELWRVLHQNKFL